MRFTQMLKKSKDVRKDMNTRGLIFLSLTSFKFLFVVALISFTPVIVVAVFTTDVSGSRSYPDPKAAFLSENIHSRKFFMPAGWRGS